MLWPGLLPGQCQAGAGRTAFLPGQGLPAGGGRHQNGAGAVLPSRSAKAPRPPAPPQSREKGGSGKPAAERPQKGGRLLIRCRRWRENSGKSFSCCFPFLKGRPPCWCGPPIPGRLLKAGEEYNTDANPVLLGELRRVLGQENVALLPPEAPKTPRNRLSVSQPKGGNNMSEPRRKPLQYSPAAAMPPA